MPTRHLADGEGPPPVSVQTVPMEGEHAETKPAAVVAEGVRRGAATAEEDGAPQKRSERGACASACAGEAEECAAPTKKHKSAS